MGTSAISITIAPEGAGEIKDTAKQLVFLRKQSNGKWLVRTVMLVEVLAFVVILGVGLLYVWKRRGLEWD